MRSGQLSFMKQHPLQCCAIFSVHRSCESNLQISNLLRTPIISWIAHIFVIAIQGGCVQTSNQKDMEFDSQISNNHLF